MGRPRKNADSTDAAPAANRVFVVRNITEGTTQYLSAKTKGAVYKFLLGDYDVSAAKRADLLAIVSGDAELETLE